MLVLACPSAVPADTGLVYERVYEPFVWPVRQISDFALAADGRIVATSGGYLSVRAGTSDQEEHRVPGNIALSDPISGGVFVGATRDPFALELVATDSSWMGGNQSTADIGAWDRLAISPDGNTLYAGRYAQGRILALVRVPDTSRFEPFQEQINETCGVESLNGVTDLTVSPDGRHLYAASSGSDSVVVFEREPLRGELHFRSAAVVGDPSRFAEPVSIVVSRDGRLVYVAARTSNSISVFQRDEVTGSLRLIQTLVDGEDGVDGIEGVTSIAEHPDGAALYAAGSREDAVAVFVRDPGSEALRFREVHRDLDDGVYGLQDVGLVRVAPDGGKLYAASGSNLIAIFRVVDLPPPTPTITPGGPFFTPTMTPTRLGTRTPTRTGTRPPTRTGTSTRTHTRTQAPGEQTWTPTNTAPATRTRTVTRTPTVTCTLGPTRTVAVATAGPTTTTTASVTPDSTPSPSAPPTSTRTATTTPTPTTVPRPECPGDCDGDGAVSVSELIFGVRSLLGDAALGSCGALDVNRDGAIGIDELLRGVRASLQGCLPDVSPVASDRSTRVRVRER